MKSIICLFSVLLLFKGICISNESEKTYGGFQNDVVNENGVYITTDDINDYDSYLDAYFANLKGNFAINVNNSCGFIALEMLLNYYDNYLNMSIVDEKYENKTYSSKTVNNVEVFLNSPGSKVCTFLPDNYGPSLSMSQQKEYFDYLISTKDIYLHSKLISIAKELNYCDNYNLRTVRKEIIEVCNEYLTNQIGSFNFKINSDEVYGVNRSGKEDIENNIINSLNSQNPVIVFSKVNMGHALLAFKYDGNYVYCHNGYYGDKRLVRFEKNDFFENANAFVNIDFSIDKYPNCNYISNDGCAYAYDYFDISTFHTHNFTKRYECDGDVHVAYCKCGCHKCFAHEFNAIVIFKGIEYEECDKCGCMRKSNGKIKN